MNRKLLLISNSTNRGEAYLEWPKEQIREFLQRHGVKSVLFIPFAGVSLAEGGLKASYNAYETKVQKVFAELGVKLTSIHHKKSPIEAVYNAECVAVGGGNTFHLVKELHRLGLMKAISERAKNGMPYMGWSAGSNVAGPTLCTTNDMPIVQPESFDCMNLVPFQINPHYTDFFDPKHGGETRDDRLKEYIMLHPNMYVAGIREATSLLLENGKLKLIGRPNKMKVFKANLANTKEYGLGDDINFLLK
ncbi:MAG: dipeptidase PepE [Bacteroidales bacterium]|nr:dipeptidase PepE [Bacteroidales bacterium]